MHCSLGDWTSLVEWIKADGKAQDLGAPLSGRHVLYRKRTRRASVRRARPMGRRLFARRTCWSARRACGCPYASVRPPEALFDDEQLLARGYFAEVEHPELGRKFRYPGAPCIFGGTPWRVYRRPPMLGEHTGEILRDDLGIRSRRDHGARERTGDLMTAAMPLDGIRVLDFTWVVAGPVACRILADHGAEVIKLERKVPGTLGPRRVGLQGDLNRNKRSVAINMGHRARDRVGAGARGPKSDIVIDNFSARVMRGWGMDYASLVEIKPDIICISMSGLGHTGPRASYVSYGPTLQALGGFTAMMRDEDGAPAGYGYSYADMAGGYTGALAALIAIWSRRRTGKGQFVDLSQFEALTSVIGPALLDIAVNRRAQEAPLWRSQEGPSAPHGIYRCRPRIEGDRRDDDRWLAISIRSHAEWERFVAAIGSPPWAADPKFRTIFLRTRNSRGARPSTSRDGLPIRTPKTRWRPCSTIAWPRRWSPMAPISARATRNCNRAASGRACDYPTARLPR